MITKEKVLKVVASLKTVEERANKKGAFNMMESTVAADKNGHPCGTVHCLAGLYAIANYERPFIRERLLNCVDYISYLNGAEIMALDLGFNRDCDLEAWLEEHPELWGNSEGHGIFSDEEAFNYPGFSGVIRHFEEFAMRLQ